MMTAVENDVICNWIAPMFSMLPTHLLPTANPGGIWAALRSTKPSSHATVFDSSSYQFSLACLARSTKLAVRLTALSLVPICGYLAAHARWAEARAVENATNSPGSARLASIVIGGMLSLRQTTIFVLPLLFVGTAPPANSTLSTCPNQ